MIRHVILIENAGSGYSAYTPDLPGCVSAGKTREEAEERMREALAFHIEGLRDAGEPVPSPTTTAAYVEVAAQEMEPVRSSREGGRRVRGTPIRPAKDERRLPDWPPLIMPVPK